MMNRNLQIFDADVTLSLDDAPLPLQSPVQAPKLWVASGVAVSVTPVP